MIHTPQVVHTTAQMAAFLHVTIPRNQIQSVMGGVCRDAWRVAAPDFYECYVTGPEASPNPAAWRTQLSRPLCG